MKFNQKIKPKQQVLIYSDENNIIRTITSEENPFEIKNSFIKKYSKINFILKDGDNSLKISPSLSYSNNKLLDKIDVSFLNSSEIINNIEVSNFGRLEKGTEILNEVIIRSKVKKWDNELRGFASSLKVTKGEDIIEPSGLLTRYIYNLWLQYRGSNRPLGAIFVNEQRIRGEWEIADITMDEVREVAFGNTAIGFYKELHVFTFSNKELSKRKPKNTFEIKLPIGFAIEKEYYQPKYPSYNNTTFENYGVINWIPNISIEPNSTKFFKTLTYSQEEIKIFFEGFDKDGRLFSDFSIFK